MPHPLPPVEISSFFASLPKPEGFPAQKVKAQPWRQFCSFTSVKEDGELLVACPKRHDFGSSGLGGVWSVNPIYAL